MAVSEQTPYIEYTANGVTTSFALEFDCSNKDHLIVLVDDLEPAVGTWSLVDGAVNFSAAPANNKKITIKRNTPFRRDSDFQSYDNSFRPKPVNTDFDRIWWKIQELGVADWLLAIKLQKFRDDVNLTALEQTLEQARDIRDDTSVLANKVQSNVDQSQSLLESTTTQANLAQGSANSANSSKDQAHQSVIEANSIKSDMYTALYSFQNGAVKVYPTLEAANADITNISLDSKVSVLSAIDGGDYYKASSSAINLTKSPYDPLQKAIDFANANAMFNPIKLGASVNLDTLKAVGIYFATTVADATIVNSYPLAGLGGIVHVVAAQKSSLIFQEFRAANGVDYWRSFNGSAWTAWKLKIDLSAYEQSSKSFTDLGAIAVGTDLNTLQTSGRYSLSDGSTIATTALNYPKAGISGTLEVIKNTSSSIVTQKFTVWNSTAPEFWIRVFRNSWSAWIKIGTDLVTTNTFKISSVFSASMLADDLRTEAAVYLVNNNTIDLVAAGLPEKSLGLLKVSKATVSSFAVQEFIAATSGKSYIRYWNGSVWSSWVSASTSSGSSSDLITFTKTATAMQWYLPNAGTGTNKLRHTYNRGINAEINRDSWGMGTASVFSAANGLVQNLTTNGVWECAIIDSQNVGDHSGGGHGDEVKFLSYFLVDGVYYAEDFAATFTAKEVKHVQHSVIYVEAQNIPICTRKTTWTFNKNGNISKTRLEWAIGRSITKARIAMLPIYRKSNQDGTGDQITDTEIRSQDDQVINVAEHGFSLRDLPISNGDSILLSSAVSNISADVKVKKIIAQDSHAYVQNTLLYNKIYVNGFMETAAPFVTGTNDVWEIETEFVIKVRS